MIKKALGITAYHGSPHKFDKFDISKIGTGEGAQVYGHGLYFAGNEGVAKSYRDALRPNLPLVHINGENTGKRITESDQVIQNMLREGKTPEQYHQMLLDSPAYARKMAAYKNASDEDTGLGITDKDIAKLDLDDFHKRLDEVKGYFGKSVHAYIPKGHMYRVHLNAEPHDLLDWDKPLSEQHPAVRDAVRATGVDTSTSGWKHGADLGNGAKLMVTPHPDLPDDDAFTKYEMLLQNGNRTSLTRADVERMLGPNEVQPEGARGAAIYQRLVDMGNRQGAIGEHLRAGNPMKTGPKWASEALARSGLKGIRYLDAGSRGADTQDPSHNYVMFHHDPVDVEERYKKGGLVDAALAKTSHLGDAMMPTNIKGK